MVPLSEVLVPHGIFFDVLAEEAELPYWSRRSDKKFISKLMFGFKPNKHLFATKEMISPDQQLYRYLSSSPSGSWVNIEPNQFLLSRIAVMNLRPEVVSKFHANNSGQMR